MTTGRSARDVCLGVLDGAEAHDYGSGYGSPGVARVGSPQAAKLTDDLLAALAEAGYVVIQAKWSAALVANRERVAEALHRHDHRCDDADHLAECRGVASFLLAAGVFRAEAKVKAEALEEAGRLIRDEHGQYDASEMLHEQAAALLAGGDQ